MADGGIGAAALRESERRNIVNRLKRLEGQVRGLQSMIESGKSCDDVLTQVMAAKSALNQAAMRIIAHSMKSCFDAEGVRPREDVVDEALEIFLKYVK
jgi:DNA-binding FrmR family transcriptional regulator